MDAIYDIIGRTLAALLIALMLPAVVIVFAIICVVAVIKTITEPKRKDPEFWND